MFNYLYNFNNYKIIMEHLLSVFGILLVIYIFYKDVILEEWLLSKFIVGNNGNNNKIEKKIDQIIYSFNNNTKIDINEDNKTLNLEWILLSIKRAIIENNKMKIKEIMDKVVEVYWYGILKKIWPTIVRMTAINKNFKREDITFIWVSILHYGQH